MKPQEVKRTDLIRLERQLKRSTKQSLHLLSCLLAEHGRSNPIEVLSLFKFTELGYDPLVHGRRLNFIEQVNQSFTVLASLKAAHHLFATTDAASIKMNLGPHKGFDLEVSDGSASVFGVAEVFAAVSPNNNSKLKKDVDRVRASSLPLRRVYFLAPNSVGFSFEKVASLDGEIVLSDGVLIKHLRG
jgi:hypothetical protein